jgi:RNA polymerase-interacting CarD/CdnL/TRCF family regulator
MSMMRFLTIPRKDNTMSTQEATAFKVAELERQLWSAERQTVRNADERRAVEFQCHQLRAELERVRRGLLVHQDG